MASVCGLPTVTVEGFSMHEHTVLTKVEAEDWSLDSNVE